jgi:hypothetical protein
MIVEQDFNKVGMLAKKMLGQEDVNPKIRLLGSRMASLL